MHKKYYWFVAANINREGDQTLEEDVLEGIHPFQKIKEYKDSLDGSGWYDIILVNYKEISEEEYSLFPKDE